MLKADGSGRPDDLRAYEDPDAEAVRAAIMDTQVMQSLGRARGVDRAADKPVAIWIMADVVLPLVVDRVDDWADLAPNVMMRMLSRGVMHTSPLDAAEAYPDLFDGSVDAAKHAIARSQTGISGPNPYEDTLIGEWPGNHPFSLCYRPPGRGQQNRRAWIRPGGASLMETLRLAGGRFAAFKVEQGPSAVAELPETLTAQSISWLLNKERRGMDDHPADALLRRFLPRSAPPDLDFHHEIDHTPGHGWLVCRVYVRRDRDGSPTRGRSGAHVNREPGAAWEAEVCGGQLPQDEVAEQGAP